MTASDRIWTIREISRRLSPEEWPIIDLTLRQFDLPWTDNWGGDKADYIIAMLAKATDEKLMDLASHLGYELQTKQAVSEPSFWRAGCFKLFVSHLSDHRAEVAELQTSLHEFHISAFVAHTDIQPTKEWEEEILQALSSADAALAMLHETFHASNWTDQECGAALGRGILCIAVSFGKAPYGFLGRFQALNGEHKAMGALAQDVFQILLSHKQTRKRMTEALVRRFEESNSFAEAKANTSLLERVPFFDERMSRKISEAAANDYQISHAFGVPERVERLLQRKQEVKKGA